MTDALVPVVNAEVLPLRQEEPSLESLGQSWLNFLDASPATVETYTKGVRQLFRYLREQGITRPVRDDLIAFKRSLSALKSTTVQTYMAATRKFFAWTEETGRYPNIAAHVKTGKVSRVFKRDYLTSSQSARLLSAVDRSTGKGLRDFAMLSLMLTTGLRTIEVVRANLEDLRTLGDDSVLYVQGKGRTDRTDYVRVEPHVEEALRAYLATRGEATGEAPLFASLSHHNAGERLTTRSVRRVVKARLAAVNLVSNRLTAHSLRHTAATLNLLEGGTTEETQQMLRHSNIATTLIYSHALERAKNESEHRVGKAIFSKLGQD